MTAAEYVLNPSAALILSLCDGNRTIGEIAQEFGRRCDVCQGYARRDVRRLVAALRSLGLVEPGG